MDENKRGNQTEPIKKFLWLSEQDLGPVRSQVEELGRIFGCRAEVETYSLDDSSECAVVLLGRGEYTGVIVVATRSDILIQYINIPDIVVLCPKLVPAQFPEKAEIKLNRPCGKQCFDFAGFEKPIGVARGRMIYMDVRQPISGNN